MKRINEKIKEKANKGKTTNAYKLNKERLEVHKIITQNAITLIALMITILFSYDEKLKCSNSKGFLLQTI